MGFVWFIIWEKDVRNDLVRGNFRLRNPRQDAVGDYPREQKQVADAVRQHFREPETMTDAVRTPSGKLKHMPDAVRQHSRKPKQVADAVFRHFPPAKPRNTRKPPFPHPPPHPILPPRHRYPISQFNIQHSKLPPCPTKLPEQVTLIRQLLSQNPTATPEQLSNHFGRKNQKRTDQIEGIIETLKGLGRRSTTAFGMGGTDSAPLVAASRRTHAISPRFPHPCVQARLLSPLSTSGRMTTVHSPLAIILRKWQITSVVQ